MIAAHPMCHAWLVQRLSECGVDVRKATVVPASTKQRVSHAKPTQPPARRLRGQEQWVVYAAWETDTVDLVSGDKGVARDRRWLAVTATSPGRELVPDKWIPSPDPNGWELRGLVFYWAHTQAQALKTSRENAVALVLCCEETEHVTYHMLRIK